MSVIDIVLRTELVGIANVQKQNWWVLAIENVITLCYLLDSVYTCLNLMASEFCAS